MMKEKKEILIEVKNVSKIFKLPLEKSSSIKSSLVNFSKRKKGYEIQRALDDVSFSVKKGEFFGIVGRNGSGKSTLLKILAGIYYPSSGEVIVKGRLTPFIELGVGFNMELTGRENVFLNGALLGFKRSEIAKMYEDIVSFAELERFMDQKLKNYSSGMQVRLAFSIAIRADSPILLLDEVLAVGDADFQSKCLDVFRRIKKEGKTIILVTHDMGNVERFCDRALVLHEGKVIATTKPHEASSIYARLNVEKDDKEEQGTSKTADDKRIDQRWGAGGIRLKTAILKSQDKKTKVMEVGKNLDLIINVERDKSFKDTPFVCGLAFINQDGYTIMGPNSIKDPLIKDTNEFTFSIKNLLLAPGKYSLTIAIFDEIAIEAYDFLDRWLTFSVISDHAVNGLVDIKGEWRSSNP